MELTELINVGGLGTTVTLLTAVFEQPAALVTLTEYCPESEKEELVITGFCRALVKLFGPRHRYTSPPPDTRLSGAPKQTVGLLIGIIGCGLTVTLLTIEATQLLEPLPDSV